MTADNTAKISHDEMISMFGQAMPLEAVTLLFNSPHEKTIGEIRAELRKIAKTRRIEAARKMTDDPMRNLSEYPITHEEIIECLETFKAGCDPELIGDMRPLLLDMAIAAVRYRQLKLWERGELATILSRS